MKPIQKRGGLKFFVNVIESPSEEDLGQGRTEGKILLPGLNQLGIPYKYALVRNYGEFMSALGKNVVEGIQEFSAIPAIHLSMHGSSEGVGLTDGKFLPWNDLCWKLRMIGWKLDGAFMLCMSSCEGISARRVLDDSLVKGDLKEKIPFGFLVGNVLPVTWNDAAVGFLAFYRLLSKGAGFDSAVRAMKAESGNESFFGIASDRSGKCKDGIPVGVVGRRSESLAARNPRRGNRR